MSLTAYASKPLDIPGMLRNMQLMTALAKALEQQGVTYSSVAAALGIHKSHVTRWARHGLPVPEAHVRKVSEMSGLPCEALRPGVFITQDGTRLPRKTGAA